jgi:hypothetical protein
MMSGGNVLVLSGHWAHPQGCAMAQAVKSCSPLGLCLTQASPYGNCGV